jgi:hypothetical protein
MSRIGIVWIKVSSPYSGGSTSYVALKSEGNKVFVRQTSYDGMQSITDNQNSGWRELDEKEVDDLKWLIGEQRR